METLSSNSATPPPQNWRKGLKAIRVEVFFLVLMAALVVEVPMLRTIAYGLMWFFVSAMVSILVSYQRVTSPQSVSFLPPDAPLLRILKKYRKIAAWMIPSGFILAFAGALLANRYCSARSTQFIELGITPSFIGLVIFSSLHAYIGERTKIKPQSITSPASHTICPQ